MSDMADAVAYAPRLVQVLHEKGTRKLARFMCVDGGVAYGVLEDDKIAFLGTKAEAKKFYGTWRNESR